MSALLKNKFILIAIFLVLMLMGASLGYAFIYLPATAATFPEVEEDFEEEELNCVEEEEIEEEKEKEEEEIEIEVSPYTGLPYDEEKLERPFALMIDNHPSARPQYGLQNASYVYEIIAEGGITRLMAIFHHEYEGDYGPIRSLRPYYAHMARENDAIMAHCGSSRQTVTYMNRAEYASVDEHHLTHKYYREPSRRAPHNLFTNLDRLIAGAEQLNIYDKTLETRNFDFEKGDNAGEVSEVRIPFDPNNNVSYKWDDAERSFLRYINNQPHTDADNDNNQISVNNIIVQYADYWFISNVHREYGLVGSGEGLLVKEGDAENITWEKEGYDKPTEFFCEEGEPVVLTPGNTWIHIITPRNKAVLIED